jgi:glycosyltransferase involved in cell wall biosynthesis
MTHAGRHGGKNLANTPCPSLADLPPPPAGKTGWPWTDASPRLADRMADGRPWPRVSIVTPSYNQGCFLEETIRSVLLQGYPNLEYIVMDGGSTDQSVRILCAYEAWLASWVSKPDAGQSDAINRGFAQSAGEILGWLNSDDVYEPGAIHRVAAHFVQNPQSGLLYGNGWYIDVSGHRTNRCTWVRPFDRKRLLTFNFVLQPAAFWRRSLWEQAGQLEVAYHWAMDWEWLIRATRVQHPDYVPVDLARWRLAPGIKTQSGGELRGAEIAAISRHYGGLLQPTYLVYRFDQIASSMLARLRPGWSRSILQRAIALVDRSLRWVWRGRCLV